MAKLKLRIPTLDGLSAEQKALYRQMEGGTGFILDHEPDADGFGIDNLAAIRGKLVEKERDYERVNARLQALKKADGSLYTSEELQALAAQNGELSTALQTLKDKTRTDEQKLADLVAQAKKPLEVELAKHKAEREAYRGKVIAAEKAKLIAKAKSLLNPLPEWEDAIEDAIGRRLEIREKEGGEFEAVIMEDGKPRMSSLMGQNGYMGVEEFAKGADFRQKYGKYLRGDGKKGADITTPADGGRGGNRQAGADVVLPPGYTQQQFEAAYEAARKAGGQVSFAEEAGQTS